MARRRRRVSAGRSIPASSRRWRCRAATASKATPRRSPTARWQMRGSAIQSQSPRSGTLPREGVISVAFERSRGMKRIVLLTALPLLLVLPARAQDPAAILARAKEAAGGKAWDAVRTLHTRARFAAGGLSGTAESWEDARTGRALDTVSLGSVTEAEGFDGKAAWTQDPSGQTHVDDSGDAREGAANGAYLRSLAYWYPERWKAEIAYAGRKEEAGRAFHVLRIHPEGGRPF